MTTYHVYHDSGSNTIEADNYRFATAVGIEGALVFYKDEEEVGVYKKFNHLLVEQSTLPVVEVKTQAV